MRSPAGGGMRKLCQGCPNLRCIEAVCDEYANAVPRLEEYI